MVKFRQSLNKDLIRYVEKTIFPIYKRHDKGHDLNHLKEVVLRSLELSEHYHEVDKNMVYTIASYHDVGLSKGRENHEVESGRILREDKNLLKWFSEEEIKIMSEAIEDHRASSESSPRSIYGKIISDADRVVDPIRTMERTILFGIDQFPNKDKEWHKKRAFDYLTGKYGKNGYIRSYLPESDVAKKLKEFQKILSSKLTFNKIFDDIWNNTH